MYVLAKNNSIVALDAATGKEVWTYSDVPTASIITSRGINYWESKDRSDRRLLFASNHMLRAIDARTGKAIGSFGKGEQATGWRGRGFEGTVGDETIQQISMPLSSDTVVSSAARGLSTWSGGPGSHADFSPGPWSG